MSEAKHTPEPWHVATNPGGPGDQPAFPSIRDGSGRPHGEDTVCMPLGDSETVTANARRIVACVNGCKGINPDAVPKLLTACQLALQELIGWQGDALTDDGVHIHPSNTAQRELRKAIAEAIGN